jgi:subtilisin family serine protease
MTVRVAVIDSGVNVGHPHIAASHSSLEQPPVAGGVAFDENGREHDDFVDRLGHGTAVTAAIREKAPDAAIYAVKVFDRVLGTRIENLIAAIDWAASAGMQVANLSLGTRKTEHEPALRAAVDRAATRGLMIVSARDDEGVRWLPGSLPGVVAVQLDMSCPRHDYRVTHLDGAIVFRASGYAREIPGVPPERNLTGISFAVANMTGFVVRALQKENPRTLGELIEALGAQH